MSSLPNRVISGKSISNRFSGGNLRLVKIVEIVRITFDPHIIKVLPRFARIEELN